MDSTAPLSADVISTAGDAALSVSDASSVATGRLVNGAFALTQPLQVKATSAAATSSGYGALTGAASPRMLLTYAGPITNDAVTLGFKQSIGSSEPLRTGNYGKTLTFTLSTTTP